MSRHLFPLLLVLVAVPAPAQEPRAKSAEELAAAVRPSLCVITTRGREGREGLGAGFVVAADGLIATNAHVIGQGRPITVEFADGKKYDAVAVHAHDFKRDLAAIRIEAKDLPALPIADPDTLKDGQPVVAF